MQFIGRVPSSNLYLAILVEALGTRLSKSLGPVWKKKIRVTVSIVSISLRMNIFKKGRKETRILDLRVIAEGNVFVNTTMLFWLFAIVNRN